MNREEHTQQYYWVAATPTCSMSRADESVDVSGGAVKVDLLADAVKMYMEASNKNDPFTLDTTEALPRLPVHHQRLGNKTIGDVTLQSLLKILIQFALGALLNGRFKVKYQQEIGVSKTPQVCEVLYALITTDPHCGEGVRLLYRCLLEVHHIHFWKMRDDAAYAATSDVVVVDQQALLDMYKTIIKDDIGNLPPVYQNAREK